VKYETVVKKTLTAQRGKMMPICVLVVGNDTVPSLMCRCVLLSAVQLYGVFISLISPHLTSSQQTSELSAL